MNAIPEISEEVHSSDLLELFDLSTVVGVELEAEKSHKAEIIETVRPVLDEMGRLTVMDDQILHVRSPEKKKELLADEMKLFDRHILRSASETVLAKEKRHREYMDTSLNTMGVTMPVMPCAKMDVEERGILYDEVVRDRDKSYRAEQQEILKNFERTGVPTSVPQHYLRLGKYNKTEIVPVNYWAPAFQSFMRRDKYLRTTRYISETYCIIEVFTLGIDGRVFSGGAPGRMLIIETYSFWSSKKSVLMLTIPMLSEIFSGEEEYFRPGMKSKLVNKLIEYLYFTYTIEPPEINEDDESVFSAADSQASGMPKHPDELQHNEDEQTEKKPHVTNRERRLAERRARGEVIPIPNKDVYRDPDEVDDEDSLNPDGVNEEEWGDADLQVEKEDGPGGGMFGGLFNSLGVPSVHLPAVPTPPWSSGNNNGKKPRTSHSRKNKKAASGGRKTPSRKSSSRGESAPAVMEKSDDTVSPLGSGRGSVGAGGLETGRSMTSHTTLTTQELEELLPQPFLDTQVVDDLDETQPIRPDLVDYPHKVASIMRAVKDPAWVLANKKAWKGYGLPQLTEELKIGKFPRKSAVKLRAEAEAARVKKIEDEEAARRAAWLAIPPMRRGFLCSRGIFSRGACIVLRAYIYPSKPNMLVVKGHSLLECKRLQINLPLSAVGFFYGEKRSPKYWPEELKPLLVRRAVHEVYAVRSGSEITDGNISLGCRDTVAFEVQCRRLQPILHGHKHNKRVKEARERTVDLRYHYWENSTPERQAEHSKFRVPSSVMHFMDNPWPAEPRYMRPMPKRHMGVTNRMYTHAGLINGVSCTLSLFFASERIPGPVPKPKKKAQKVFDRIDKEWEELEARRLEDAERLRKLEEDERLNKIREEARRVRAQRMEEMKRRHADFITDKEEHHKLTRRKFLEKYAAPYNLSFLEFKELWGQTEYGVWHYTALQEMILAHEKELVQIRQAHQREQDALQQQHDEEEEAMRDPNHVHLKHHHSHQHHKHHHAYSDRRRHRHHKYKHESGEERKALLHAVEIMEGESADEFRIRRMQEAIHLKKDKGKKEKEQEGEGEGGEHQPEAHGPEFYEYHQVSRPTTAAAEDDSDAGSEDDWVNEDSAETGEELANKFLQEYASGFELRLEAYFSHEGCILGQVIPAQSVLVVSIRREDVYRVVPSYREAIELLQGAYLASWQAEDGGRASDEQVQTWFDRYRDLVSDLLLVSRWTVQSTAETFHREKYQQQQQELFAKMSQPEEEAPEVDPLAAAAAAAATTKEAEEGAHVEEAEKPGAGEPKGASVDEDDDDFFNDLGDDDGEGDIEDEEEEEDDVKTLPMPMALAEATALRNRMFEVNAGFKPVSGNATQSLCAEEASLRRERCEMGAWDKEQHREKVVMLCWPSCRISHFGNDWGPQVIFRKTLKIRTNVKGHKHALMFVEVWLRGAREMGVIARDVRRDVVHFVRPDTEYQEAQAAMLQYMSQTERIATLTVALQMDLMLVERPCTEDRDKTRIGLVFDQDAEVELSEDEEEEEIDYTEILAQQQREMEEKMAAKAAKMAEVKAKMEKAKKEKQEKERKEREEAEAAASQASEQEDAI